MPSISRALILTSFFLFLTSCEIKDSVFGTEIKSTKLWNQKFTIPAYNMAGGAVVRFAVVTDSHQNYADLRNTIRYVNNSNSHFVVHTGDFTDFGSSDEYGLFIDYVQDFKAPLYVVPGNHDLTAGGLQRYRETFGVENRAITTDFGKLIFWNNNRMEIGTVDYSFLSTEVASADNTKPVFLFHHQDPYNSLPFTPADNALYDSILQSHPQVVVFHGHLHRFYTQTINGIPFFQINRVEGDKWSMVEVDNSNIRVYYCSGKSCTLESTL